MTATYGCHPAWRCQRYGCSRCEPEIREKAERQQRASDFEEMIKSVRRRGPADDTTLN